MILRTTLRIKAQGAYDAESTIVAQFDQQFEHVRTMCSFYYTCQNVAKLYRWLIRRPFPHDAKNTTFHYPDSHGSMAEWPKLNTQTGLPFQVLGNRESIQHLTVSSSRARQMRHCPLLHRLQSFRWPDTPYQGNVKWKHDGSRTGDLLMKKHTVVL